MAKRIVSIDFGLARIGVAVSDESKMLASPLTTVQGTKKMEETVKRLMIVLDKDRKDRRYEIEEIVVGLPLLMSGKSGLMADEVRHFISVLQQQIQAPIVTWDERLTSVQADRSLRESSLSRKRRAKVVDVLSAVIILQNYLDSKCK